MEKIINIVLKSEINNYFKTYIFFFKRLYYFQRREYQNQNTQIKTSNVHIGGFGFIFLHLSFCSRRGGVAFDVVSLYLALYVD